MSTGNLMSVPGKCHVSRPTVHVLRCGGEAALLQHIEYPLSAFRGVAQLEMNLTHLRTAERAHGACDDVFGGTRRIDLQIVRTRHAVLFHELVNRQDDGRLAIGVRLVALAAEAE